MYIAFCLSAIHGPEINYTMPGLKCPDIYIEFTIASVSLFRIYKSKMTLSGRDGQVKSGKKKYFILIVFAVTILSCAQQRPVLYPNAHLKQVAKETAESDIDDCIQLAIDYGAKEDSGAKVAKDTAKGAAVGGATGTAVGAVTGNLGVGAAAGAAFAARQWLLDPTVPMLATAAVCAAMLASLLAVERRRARDLDAELERQRVASAALTHSSCRCSMRIPSFSIFFHMRSSRFSVQWLASI